MQKGLIMNIPRRFVTSEWGGTETVIKETAKQLRLLGFQTEIVTTKALSDKSVDTIDSVPVKRFDYSYTRWGLSKTNKALLDMRGGNMYSFGLLCYLLLTKNIKVIHLHTLGRLGNLARWVAKLKGIPYIVSIHGGLYDLPQKQLQDLVAPTKHSFNWGKLIDLFLPSKGLMRDASAIVCVGAAERDKIAAHYPNQRVEFIPNGVDLDYIRSGKSAAFFKAANASCYDWNHNDKIILCVSSFYPQKNQLTLLKAFNKARQSNPSLKLVLVGVVYDKDYFASLNDYINENHLEEVVWIRTNLNYGEAPLADCYQAADTFVLSSRYETFGIVVLEAWASGASVICSDAGGLGSLVSHEHDALVTDVESETSICHDMLRIQSDKALKRTLEKNASETVENYSWQTISKRLAKLYDDVQQEEIAR